MKLFHAHPAWEDFPHRDYADMQFFGLATDVMLDAARLKERLPEASAVRLQGGMGAQPAGFKRNVAGYALYRGQVRQLARRD